MTKTRLCLQYERGNTASSGGVFYKGTTDALIKIYRMEGIRGLYKVQSVRYSLLYDKVLLSVSLYSSVLDLVCD